MGIEGGNTAFVTPVSEAGCSELGTAVSPDALFGPYFGGLLFTTGSVDSAPSSWFLSSFADFNRTGVIPAAGRCAGDKLLIATEKGLNWISTRDLTSSTFSSPAGFGNGVTAILPLDAGKVLIGLSQSSSSLSPVRTCDLTTFACDQGATGFTLPFGDVVKLLYRFPSSSTVVAALDANGPWRSTDNGASWTKGTPAFPLLTTVTGLVASGGSLYLAGGGGVYRSNDQGATWQLARNGLGTNAGATSGGIAATSTALFSSVNSSGTSAATIYKSTDGAASWTPSSSGFTASTVNALSATPNAVWAATNAGVFRSADGASWAPYNRGLFNTNITRLAGSGMVFAATAGESSGVFRSTDGGQTWVSGGAVLSNANIQALAVQGSTVLASGLSAAFRSTDAGVTWSPLVSNLPAGSYPYALAAQGGAFYAGFTNGAVRRSTDGGSTWTAPGAGLPASGFVLSVGVSGSDVVASVAGVPYRSTDGGNSWTKGAQFSSQVTYNVNALTFSGNTLFAALDGSPFGIFRSEDLGSSWTPLTNGITAGATATDVQVGGARIFAATNRGIFTSTDGGSSWALLPGSPGRAQVVLPDGNAVFIGTNNPGTALDVLPLTSMVQRLVPIVLDVDNGSAHYTSDLALTNRGTTDAQVSMFYTGAASIGGGSGTGTVTDLVAKGSQLLIPDVLAYLRTKGLAIPVGGSQGGTLLVTFAGVSDVSAIAAVARTTAATSAPQPAGSAGLAYSGVDPAFAHLGSQTIYGLRSTATDRSNVAVYNTTAEPVTYSVTAFSGDGTGASAVIAASDSLPAYGWVQYNRILDTAGFTNGWVVITRLSSTGAVGAYGVVNDNTTNDGSILLSSPRDIRPLFLNVPVLVETVAASPFLTELVLANSSQVSASFLLTYKESSSPAGGAGGPVSVAMPPMTQQIIPGAIDWLRGMGVAIGPKGAATYAGSLNIYVTPATAAGRIFAGARTASQSSAGGQYGLFTPAVLPGDEAVSTATLYGLKADATNRSNVAVANTAASAAGGPVTLLLEACDGDAGGVVRGSQSVTLQPGEWSQLNGFLGNTGVKNGWVRLTRTGGGARWIAYGVVNDGGSPGARTGDGAYVPMQLP